MRSSHPGGKTIPRRAVDPIAKRHSDSKNKKLDGDQLTPTR